MQDETYKERLMRQQLQNPVVRNWPTLYHLDKNSNIREWTVHVEGNEVITSHGIEGGEIQESAKQCSAKRVGQSNATTPHEQALAEAQSQFEKRLRLKYSLSIDEACQQKIRPMLAKKYNPEFSYGRICIQPKYDGMRCMVHHDFNTNEVRMMSRGNKEFHSLNHIRCQLQYLFQILREGGHQQFILDGELYTHNTPFQTVASWIKKDHPESKKIRYTVYDAYFPESPNMPFSERYRLLSNICHVVGSMYPTPMISIAPTYETEGMDDNILKIHRSIVAEGYEGSMIRVPSSRYELGVRSDGLLKLKDFEDSEFKIVSIGEGRGKFKGLAIFTCRTDSGKHFDTVIKGTEYERARYYKERQQHIGKMLTVRYQGRSTSGIPRFPVGIAIREEGY